ncbi:MAG TPA: sialidase family protein [Gemmatimonadaceae bacterium]|nr:sialidase family protein [Gemmatimonadaceae bacterium]
MFVRVSDDGGATWGAAQKAGESAETYAQEPHVLVDPHNRVHVVWSEGGGWGPRVALWHAVSRSADLAEAGVSWTSSAMPLHDRLTRTKAAIDRCGTVHVVFEVWSGQRIDIGYARFGNAGWSSIIKPFDKLGGMPSLAVGDDVIHLVWDRILRKGDPKTRTPIQTEAVHSTLAVSG